MWWGAGQRDGHTALGAGQREEGVTYVGGAEGGGGNLCGQVSLHKFLAHCRRREEVWPLRKGE